MKRHIREANLLNITMAVLALAFLMTIPRQTAAQTNTFPSSGNTGVGTTSPTYKLQVNGNGGTAGDSVLVTDSNTTTTAVDIANTSSGAKKWRLQSVGSTVSGRVGNFELIEVGSDLKALVVQPGGNVGIGTTSPASLLDIRRDAAGAVGPTFTLSNNTGGTGAGGAIDFSMPSLSVPQQAQIRSSDNNDWSANLLFLTKMPGAGTNALAERMRISSNGDVGIGTTSPGGPIDIRDSNGRQLLWNMSGAGHSFLNANGGNVHVAANLYFNGTAWNRYNTAAGGGMWWAGSDGSLGVLQAAAGSNPVTAFSYPLSINTSGYVGVGTTTPTFKLDVQNGAVNASGGLCIAGDCKTAWSQVGGGSSQWSASGSSISYSSGNVGIGTASPLVGLHVASANTTSFRVIASSDSSGNSGYFAGFTGGNSGGTPVLPALFWSAGEDMRFGGGVTDINGGTGWTEAMRITNGGNVGIGTTSPTEKLHVSGNAKITGNLTVDGSFAAKYQDVAEWVPTTEQLSTGTVVVLDSTRSNEVIASSQAYDTRVAGVISEQPGIALGDGGTGKVLVATTGRVRVKVDASRAPIHIGDLLVTSDINGIAMKSEPVNLGGVQLHRPGTLIGKALEPLDKGTGTILVLLSLQ